MSDRIARPDNRLSPNRRSVSKYAATNPNAEREKAQRLAELEKSRDRLYGLIAKFSSNILSQTLQENMSIAVRDEQSKLPQEILEEAKNLNSKNLNEGYDVVLAACLHTLLNMKDRANDLKYQNFLLKEQLNRLAPKTEK